MDRKIKAGDLVEIRPDNSRLEFTMFIYPGKEYESRLKTMNLKVRNYSIKDGPLLYLKEEIHRKDDGDETTETRHMFLFDSQVCFLILPFVWYDNKGKHEQFDINKFFRKIEKCPYNVLEM